MRLRTTGAAGAAVAAVAALALAGCGSGSGGSGNGAAGSTTGADGTSSASAAGAGSGSSTGRGTAVTVTATEFALTLPSPHLSPGTYTFTMRDDGHATHAIAIEGGGLSGATSAAAGPGGSATLTVTLQPGSYTMYCPVGNHRSLGMQTTLTVG